MPLFEFVCSDCLKEFTFLSGVVAENTAPSCPRCGSLNLQKRISRVARGRSDDERMDAMAEYLETRDLDDQAVVRRLTREMGRGMDAATGQDMGAELEALMADEGSDSATGGGSRSASSDDGTIY